MRLISILLMIGLFTQIHPMSTLEISSAIPVKVDENMDLVIYTYESLFAFPEYDFVKAFENFAGLQEGSIQVVRFADAGNIVTNAVLEKANPVADVLIGIDNALVHKARSEDILTPYKPSGAENIITSLVDTLAGDYLLTPYDFGIISLWYLNDYFAEFDFNDFTLEDLLDPSLGTQVITENPALSSPGLGFLLWTIAVFGDDESGVDGLVNGDWKAYWTELAKNILIVGSWGEALDILYTEESGRQMMVSYSSSPAFGSCTANDTSTSALLSNENNQQNGWQQVEGIGLVKNAPHETLAKQFIDWFISAEVQNQVMESQWIFPAYENITTPSCYDIAIHPNDVNPLNNRIPQSILANNLDQWLDDWEIAVVDANGDDKFLSFLPLYSMILSFGIIIILRKFVRIESK